jgi:hypothetical protein
VRELLHAIPPDYPEPGPSVPFGFVADPGISEKLRPTPLQTAGSQNTFTEGSGLRDLRRRRHFVEDSDRPGSVPLLFSALSAGVSEPSEVGKRWVIFFLCYSLAQSYPEESVYMKRDQVLVHIVVGQQ